MDIWELRFVDGRGSRVFTAADVTSDIGKPSVIRSFEIAAVVGKGAPVADAKRCLSAGRTLYLTAHMGAVAYAVRHPSDD